jgi:hypothetical protein
VRSGPAAYRGAQRTTIHGEVMMREKFIR